MLTYGRVKEDWTGGPGSDRSLETGPVCTNALKLTFPIALVHISGLALTTFICDYFEVKCCPLND